MTDKRDAMDYLNAYAPEHLILVCADAEEIANNVRNAGSVFIGNFAPESAGDYASGTNHTLPTNGYAKAFSGISIDSFVKKDQFPAIDSRRASVDPSYDYRDGLSRRSGGPCQCCENSFLTTNAGTNN